MKDWTGRKSPFHVARRLWRYGRPYSWRLVAGLGLLLATNALALWIPWLLRNAVRAMEREVALRRVAAFAGAMVAVAVVQAVVRTGSRLVLLGASRRIAYDIRNRFFSHLQRMGGSFFDRYRTGDLMSRGINDLRLLRVLYGFGVMNLLNTSIIFTATLVILFRINPRLTGVALAVFPFLFLAVNRLSKRVYGRSVEVQEALSDLSNRAQENLSGIRQVMTYVQEDREIAAFREASLDYRGKNLALTVVRGMLRTLVGMIAGIGTLIVLFLGGRDVVTGRMSFPDFVAFQTYLAMLTWPTVALGWIINVFQRGAGALARVEEILSTEPDVPPALDEEDAPGRPLEGDIRIRNLHFRYGGQRDRTPALNGVDLEIPKGSRVALVGPVGSGKSTLANLLARLYPVPRGAVTIGGVDINDIPVQRLRRSIGYVPQETFLFSRSLRENIALGRPEATDEEIARSVDISRLENDLGSFPEGLETRVGERGVTLSGGQGQRTSLARAVVGDPRILILDDSLSAVDADTEQSILRQLDGMMRGRTCLIITHRLTTLAGADRIVVLDEGRVVEQGTHEDLVQRDGLYAHLFHRQLLEARLENRP